MEILIGVAILALITGVLTISFAKTAGSKALEADAENLVEFLNSARSRTLSAENDAQYGVYLESDRAIIFRGNTYSSSDPENIVWEFNPRVTLSSINLSGGGSEVVFTRLTGASNRSGTLTLSLVNDSSQTRTVAISLLGISEIQ